MRASYKQLITEHEAIEAAANTLLADVDKGYTTSPDLASRLAVLAHVVEQHVTVEDAIVSNFDQAQLSGPWIAAWQEGADAFETLKTGWTAFLKKWTDVQIEEDRDGFATDACEILGRLRERVQVETRAFYATALQTGAIGLR